MVTAAGGVPWPTFWIFVLAQDVCIPTGPAASSNCWRRMTSWQVSQRKGPRHRHSQERWRCWSRSLLPAQIRSFSGSYQCHSRITLGLVCSPDVHSKISGMSRRRRQWLSERMMLCPHGDPLSGGVGRVVCPDFPRPSTEPHGRPSQMPSWCRCRLHVVVYQTLGESPRANGGPGWRQLLIGIGRIPTAEDGTGAWEGDRGGSVRCSRTLSRTPTTV